MLQIRKITDLNGPELAPYRTPEKLLLSRRHPSEAMFIAESPRVILRALQAGYAPLSILAEVGQAENPSGEAAEVLNRCSVLSGTEAFPVYTAEQAVLAQLTGFQLTRGMLCAMRRRELPSVAEACAGATRLAVLEDVVNPTNVGAIFRSAAALGMDAVLLTRNSADPLYRRAIRVSMGTVFQIPWTYLPEEGIGALKPLGFQTVAMALREDSCSIRDPGLIALPKLAVVLGTEGDGLAETTIADCDYTVMIPMTHGVDSLNVAAASAVAFWQLGHGAD